MSEISEISEISPTELKNRLDSGEKIVLLDIREPHELMIASMENAVHIPKGELGERLSEIDAYKNGQIDIVVFCRTGRRSVECSNFLREAGFNRVFNLTGGLHAWSDDVDCTVMKY